MLLEGYTSDTVPQDETGSREIFLEKPNLWIKARDVPKILENKKALEDIRFFVRFKRYGLPFGGGWAEHPNRWIELIDFLDPIDRIYHPPLM